MCVGGVGWGGSEGWKGNSKQKDERNEGYNEERERKGGEREEKISERSRAGFATDFCYRRTHAIYLYTLQ